jgi:hypothetical protein
MSAGTPPDRAWLSFRRIVDIPFGTCVAALESWQLTGQDSGRHTGQGLMRGPIEHDPDSGTPAGSSSAWPAGRCARCCA